MFGFWGGTGGKQSYRDRDEAGTREQTLIG